MIGNIVLTFFYIILTPIFYDLIILKFFPIIFKLFNDKTFIRRIFYKNLKIGSCKIIFTILLFLFPTQTIEINFRLQ